MTEHKNVENFLVEEKKEALEFVEIIIKVPKEKKKDIESLINGFCLGFSIGKKESEQKGA